MLEGEIVWRNTRVTHGQRTGNARATHGQRTGNARVYLNVLLDLDIAAIQNGVGWHKGTWVVVGRGGVILTSTDANNWAACTSGTPHTLTGVIRFGSLWVVVGEAGTILTSLDNVHWTTRTSGIKADIWAVLPIDKMVMAVAEDGTILTSPDAITWTAHNVL